VERRLNKGYGEKVNRDGTLWLFPQIEYREREAYIPAIPTPVEPIMIAPLVAPPIYNPKGKK
jgi:hypothetical protein